MVWPIATPMAIGKTPMTAETWERTTYASAFTGGQMAEATPYPIEVRKATSTDQPASLIAHPPWPEPTGPTREARSLDEGGQMVQAGDLGIHEGRTTEPADGDGPITRQGGHDD